MWLGGIVACVCEAFWCRRRRGVDRAARRRRRGAVRVCERERGGGAPQRARKRAPRAVQRVNTARDRRWRVVACAVRCAARTRDARRRCRRRSALTPGGFASAAAASARERLRWATSGRCAAPVIDSAAVLGGVQECTFDPCGTVPRVFAFSGAATKRLCLVSERLRHAREWSCHWFVPFGWPRLFSSFGKGLANELLTAAFVQSATSTCYSTCYGPIRSRSTAPGNAIARSSSSGSRQP